MANKNDAKELLYSIYNQSCDLWAYGLAAIHPMFTTPEQVLAHLDRLQATIDKTKALLKELR